MNLNNKEEYWNKRSEQRIVDAENLTTDMLKKLKKVYERAYLSIEKELNAFYGKYSTETGLDITEVRKRLDPKELKTFKEQLQIYYNEVKRLGGYSKDTKEYLRELSAKTNVSRLDALLTQVKFQIETLYRQVNLSVTSDLENGYKETYYKGTFDNQKGIGFVYEFNALDDNKVRVAITQNWQGSNFSDRIWNDKDKLIDTINQKIPQGIALGQNPRKVARELEKTLDTRYSNCERLARTEMNHIANEASKLSYKQIPDVMNEYKILATLDNRTSEICFVGTDKVQTVSDVEKLFKRNYTGKIITITTACGNQIKGTPNHPVLTSNGWLTLDEINPSEHIVYSILDESVGVISKKNVNVPTKLSKLFNSIREITVRKIQTASSSTTKFNNNRTICQGKIHVLNTDRILRYWRKTVVNKHIIKDFFTFIHNSINLFCLRVLSKFFFTREIVNMTPEVKVFTFSKLIKPTFRPIKFFDNFSWFNSIIEHINSSNSISIISAIMFAPLKLWHNPEFFKNICNCRGSSFILFCNFASGHTIPVLADNVIDKRCELTNNCQVYNLQTSDNTYINNKIIVHNCQEMDGKVFKMSEWETGVTAPPFHVRCRTTTIPYFEDMPIEEFGRIATDYSTGQAYYVPSNMTYKEWRESLTEKQNKYFIADKKIREQHNADKEQLANYRKLQTQANKNGMSELFEGLPKNLQDFQAMKYLDPDKYSEYVNNARIARSELR